MKARTKARYLVVPIVLGVLSIVTPSTASAAVAPTPGTSSATAVQIPASVVAEAKLASDAIARFGGSVGAFDANAARRGGVPAAIVSGIVSGASSASVLAAARCAGRNGIRRYSSWWQRTVTVYMLNSCNANLLGGVLSAGSGVAAVVSVLLAAGIVSAPGAVATAIASAIMAVGAGAVQICSRNGTGLEVHKAYYGVWCTNQ